VREVEDQYASLADDEKSAVLSNLWTNSSPEVIRKAEADLRRQAFTPVTIFPEPSSSTTISVLWYVLVGTLAAVVLVAAGALIVSLFVKANGTTTSQVILTVFTTAFAALVGLFAPTPSQTR
jgi:hypothetical protein